MHIKDWLSLHHIRITNFEKSYLNKVSEQIFLLFLPMVPGGGTVGLQMDFFFSFSFFSFSHPTNFGGWVGLYCVLYCTVLYCIVLYCTVLYCIVLYCTVLYCIVLYCTVLYCTVLYCTVQKIHPPKKNNPPSKKKNPPPPKKKNHPPQNVQNKGGLNCTVDRGSCAADALLFVNILKY